jgi:ribosome biogenesis protein Nip4
MEITNNDLSNFKTHSAQILDKVNSVKAKDTLGRTGHKYGKRTSVMYFVMRKDNKIAISVGHMSKGGSFIPTYNQLDDVSQYVRQNMITLFSTFHKEYTKNNPTKNVLYIRHNVKRNIVEMFNTSGCTIASRVFQEIQTQPSATASAK